MADMESQANMDSAQSTEAAPATSVSQAPVAQDVPTEKYLPQSEVNKLVGRIKDETYNKAMRDAESKYQNQTQASSMGGIQQYTPEQIDKLISDKVEQQKQMGIAQQIAQDFTQKMVAGKEKYPDFESVVTDLNLPNIPQIVHWANGLDNTADVIYEIAKHPAKLANVLMLANSGVPHLAQKELQKLSASIKTNVDAKNSPQANEPLTHINHSTTGTDNGSMSVKDYRAQDWLRA